MVVIPIAVIPVTVISVVVAISPVVAAVVAVIPWGAWRHRWVVAYYWLRVYTYRPWGRAIPYICTAEPSVVPVIPALGVCIVVEQC